MPPLIQLGVLPFIVPTLAEDGNPFQLWDGVTYYSYPLNNRIVPDYPDGWPGYLRDVVGITPSASSASLVRVYGEGSEYCIPLTAKQVAELVVRAKKWKIEYPVKSHRLGSASFKAPTNGQWENAYGGNWYPQPYSGSVPSAAWTSNLATGIDHGQPEESVTEQTLWCSPRTIAGYDPTNGAPGPGVIYGGPGVNGASNMGNFGFRFEGESFGPSDFILAEDGTYWWRPNYKISIEMTSRSAGAQESQGSIIYDEYGNSRGTIIRGAIDRSRTSFTKNTFDFDPYWFAINLNRESDNWKYVKNMTIKKIPIPYKVFFSGSVVEAKGTGYLYKQPWDLSSGQSPPSGSVNYGSPLEFLPLTISIEEWWTYDGTYDPATGYPAQ